MTLQAFFTQHPKVAIAFSGGCDSAYLLYEAAFYGDDVRAYYINTPFQPAFELKDAEQFCQLYRIPLVVLDLDVCAVPEIMHNDNLRCYYCKRAIFSRIREASLADGYSVLLDGTNASDDSSDRPGMKALSELEVISPLRQCNLTKEEIRAYSCELGLFTHDKPSYACLATRIATGTPIFTSDLERIELCEDILTNFGFSDFRIRIYNHIAKIQLPLAQFSLALKYRESILNSFKPYFSEVLLDLQPRV
ncbi:MAG: ATP-dependent sacrificial sulfur transferase LarE [Lachnospiraceae bacterium]